jgi:hypothetical protein
MAAYSRRVSRKRKPLSAEFMTLLIVVAAGFGTAWWAGQQVAMNLSAIQWAASMLGITETIGTTRPVGYTEAHASQDGADSSTAPFCQSGQSPAFANGLRTLHQQIGNIMGLPVECEHPATVVGDTVQQTTTGLAAYNSLTNTDTFTDGWRHWALTPNGLVAWEGTDSTPPLQAAPSPDQAGAPTQTQ